MTRANRIAGLLIIVALCCACALCAHADGVAADITGWDETRGYTYVAFGRAVQDAGVEPIHWRVLTVKNDRALLLADKILDCLPFDYEDNDWDYSQLKRHLNNAFYHDAFTLAEQAAVVPNPGSGAVLIPVRAELTNPLYGFARGFDTKDANRIAYGTTYALGNNLWQAGDGAATYFTRTQGSSKKSPTVDMVRANGSIGSANVARDNVGVRPMIWLDLAALTGVTWQGEGTADAPYTVEGLGNNPEGGQG